MSPLKSFSSKKSRASLALIITDLFSFIFSYALAILFRSLIDPWLSRTLEPLENYWLLVVFNILILLLIFLLMGLYRGYGMVAVVELRNITQSILIAYIILAFSAYMIGEGGRLSRVIFGLSLVFCLFFIPMLRFLVYNLFSRYKNWGVKVVVIASREQYPDLTMRLQNIRRLGFNPETILCVDFDPDDKHLYKNVAVEQYSHEICQKIRAEGIEFAFYTANDLSTKDVILMEISQIFPTIYYVLPESNLSSLWLETSDLLGRPALKMHYPLLEKFPNFAKRTIEFIFVGILLILSLPFTVVIALIIKIEDGGPVFFYQDRLGLNGKPFRLIKFRTMVKGAEELLNKYLADNYEAQQEYLSYRKLKKDPRITHVGSFMRKYSIDEIPQLINVLRGDMNLIGPRAYMLNELDINNEITKTILRVKPGVTGWWQVMGRNDATFKERQKLDLYYIANWSLWLDYYILIKTIWIVLSGQGK